MGNYFEKYGKTDAAPASDANNFGGVTPLTPGNVDPWNRPALKNPDGSVSTTSSMSIGTDKGEVLIPTVIDGQRLSDDDAIKHYRDTGEHLGVFDTPENADKYAQALHEEQARRMGIPDPPKGAAGAPKPSQANYFEKYGPPQGGEGESLWEGLKRNVPSQLRAIVKGATGLAYLPGDIAAGIANYGNSKLSPDGYDVTMPDGSKKHVSGQVPLPSEQRDQALTDIGLKENAQTPLERVTENALEAGAGAAAPAGLASKVEGPIAEALAAKPAAQVAAGATGGAASGAVREEGGGPVAQTVAGLAASAVPGLAGSALTRGTDAAENAASAAARARATASATPGTAAADATANGELRMSVKGGGSTTEAPQLPPEELDGLSEPQQRVLDAGKKIGMRVTPGQATGSRPLQMVEARMESHPLTSGPFNTIKRDNAHALNRAAARAIGVDSNTLDDVTLGRAVDRMKVAFEGAADDTPRSIDPQAFVDLRTQLQGDTRGLIAGDVADHPLMQDLAGFAQNGEATGKQLHVLSSKLGNAAYKQMTSQGGDRDLGHALYNAKEFVDDQLMQGMEPGKAAAFMQARQQYRNLMLLLSRPGIVNPATGNVSGRALAGVLQRRDRNGYTLGRNRSPMYQAARFAQAFQPIVGDSGTATRSMPISPTDWALSLPFNLAARAYTSSPAIKLATGAAAALRAVPRTVYGIRLPEVGDVPAAGVAGAASVSPQNMTPEQRRKMALVQQLAEARQ